MATHSSTLAWKIPWMEEPSRLQSMGSRRVGHDRDFTFTFHFHALEKEMATHSSILTWRIPGTGEPGGLPSMGLHSVGHNWSDLAAAAWTWKWYGAGILKNHDFYFPLPYSRGEGRKNRKDDTNWKAMQRITLCIYPIKHKYKRKNDKEKFDTKWSHRGKI